MLVDVRAEGRKLVTLPVVPLSMLATFVVTVALAGIASWSMAGLLDDAGAGMDFSPEDEGFQSVHFGQAGMVVLGVLAVGGEFAGNQVRTSLLAMPGRLRFLAAKAAVVALLAALTASVTVPLAFTASQIALGEYGMSLSTALDAGVLTPMAGAVLYWVLLALLAAGCTVLARNTVAPLAVLVALVLALSQILSMVTDLGGLLPDQAGSLLYLTDKENAFGLDAPQGGAVMAAWVAVVWLLAAVRFVRRDA
ncbi:ABC transporter permease [Nocardiopsis sp. MG754419]|uniref:ABC transporter permease n=1 Tax=Nocardiopsis sp. MG754419 TaxID=2259865 RepID=UPI001BAAF8A5|nr:ABC transporter permease [Nocardiopsis sp. MG754419]MBR8740396.1 ABC transporter permease [Nocardiopsis sp. MG754419]